MSAIFTVVGIGADGWPGMTDVARAAILAADLVVGSERQLASLPPEVAARQPWPSPLAPLLDALLERPVGTVAVLASGDPMLHGIGATIARRVPPSRLTIIPHLSALALACARLHWPEAEVTLISAVTAPANAVARVLQPGRQLVVYVAGTDGAAQLARALTARGYGASAFTVLERLGAANERIKTTTAAAFGAADTDPLCCVAVEPLADADTTLLPTTPGLPDDAYEHDGALTKRHVRAATLAALAPAPHALLWDVGAGSGSIAIEWMRAEPTARAIAIEPRDERAQRIARNAALLGVPGLTVVNGTAPEALAGHPSPDAAFIGGGLTSGILEQVWSALLPGGRLVANAVTLEGEALLIDARARHGGELVKLAVSHAEPLGNFTAWRPALPVVQWTAVKERP